MSSNGGYWLSGQQRPAAWPERVAARGINPNNEHCLLQSNARPQSPDNLWISIATRPGPY